MTGSSEAPEGTAAAASGGDRPAGPPLRIKLLFLSIVVLATLVVAELAARAFVPRDLVGPSAAMHDPYYGKRLKPNYEGVITANGISYRFSTNSLGFRGPEPAGPLEGVVLILGDSYSMGDTVDDGQEYASLLRERLGERLGGSAPAVVNAGMAGTGQGRWLKLLRRDAAEMSPGVVVMQFCSNDFRDVHGSRLFKLEDGELVERPVPPQSVLRRGQEVVESIPLLPYSRLYAVSKQAVKRLLTDEAAREREHRAAAPDDRSTESTSYDDLFFRLTEACLAECERRGWPVVGLTAQFAEGERLARLRGLLERYGAELVVIPPTAERPELSHETDDHWNERGHELVAERLAPVVAAALGSPGGDATEGVGGSEPVSR